MTFDPSNDDIPADELAHAARIAEGNAAFLSMTPAQQRVRIAEETIAAIDAGEFRAENGTYLWQYSSDHACVGCGLGLSFATMCNLNGWRRGHLSPELMRQRMVSYFSESEMKTIECAFEGWSKGLCGWREVTDSTTAFNAGIDDPNERLRRIMRNIIKHKGTFVPEDRTRGGTRGRKVGK